MVKCLAPVAVLVEEAPAVEWARADSEAVAAAVAVVAAECSQQGGEGSAVKP